MTWRRWPQSTDRLRPAVARFAVAMLAAAAAACWSAGGAAAHAQLLEVLPADGATVADAPSEVLLRFSEQVSLTGGSAAVLDDEAREVSTGAAVVDDDVVIALRPGLADGTYTVSWQIISTDSHRIGGASIFHVGAPSGGGVAVDVSAGEAAWGVRFGAAALSAVAYAGALIAVGGVFFALLTGRSRQSDDGRYERIADGVVARSAVIGAAALIAAVPFRVARLGGALDSLRDDDLLAESLRGPIGVSTAVTVGGLLGMLACASATRARPGVPWAWLAGGLGVVALAGFAIEGHTRSQQPRSLMVGLDVVHMAAAAMWLGGIASLAVAFRCRVDPVRLGSMVVRFSTVAVISVIVVAAAGVGMSWIVLPSVGDLLTTGYGLALLTKVALVLVVVGLGTYNRRRLVPAVSRGAAAAPEARRRLGTIVRLELVVLLLVVAVTAVLVARSPVPSTAAAPPPVAITPDTVDLALSGGSGTASFAIAPARAGTNEIRLSLRDAAGEELVPVEAPVVELVEPTLEIGPLRPVVHEFGDGTYHVIADIPLAGRWEISIRVRVSDFESATADTVVEIAP